MPLFKTLRFKIILTYSVIILIFAILLFYNNTYSMDVIRKQIMSSTQYSQQLFTSKIDSSMDDLRNYLITILNQNPELLDLSADTQSDYYPNIQKIQLRLDKDRAVYSISDVLFYYSNSQNKLITSVDSSFQFSDVTNAITLYLKENKALIQNRTQNDNWKLLSLSNSHGFIRVISDGGDNFIGAWVSAEKLFGFEKVNNPNAKTYSILISTKGDTLLSSPGTNPLLSNLAARNIVFNGQKYLSHKIDGKKYLFSVFYPKKIDVIYSTVLQESDAFQNLSYFRTMGIFIPISVALALVMILIYLRQLLFKPIDTIVKAMRRVSIGDLSVRLEKKGITELSFLIDTFNEMVSQIKRLKIDVLDEQLRLKEAQFEKQKAELKYLQLQINPHFLANSLSIVYNLTLINDLETIRKLTLHMAQYFRYSMKIKSSLVNLNHEISFVNDYLAIQKIRFTRRLEYNISLPEDFNNCNIPPVSIQPFVENCIIHSMVEFDRPLVIDVIVTSETEIQSGNFYTITVRDNGVGFSEESLKMLNDPSFINNSSDSHTGIWNVFYRLKLNFADKFQISFVNGEISGGIVRLTIPYINS